MIILQGFVFDKAPSGSKDSSLVQPERAPSGYPKVHFFKVYFFVSWFSTMPLNRTKLKYGTMKLKAFEKITWMIELGAIYLLGPKGSLSVQSESSL